jgi:flagellar hook-associated protein 2
MAGSLFITGLSSGIDWSSIVTEMMTAARVPETTMQNQVVSDNDGLKFWSGLNTDLYSLQSSVDDIRRIGGDVFDTKSAMSSNDSVLTASIKDNTTPNSYYNINVTSLASFALKSGGALYTGQNVNPLAAVVSSSDSVNSSGNTVSSAVTLGAQGSNFDTVPDGSGTISINGVAVNWSSTDSMNDIAARINSAGAGVTAVFDAQSQKFTINSNVTGTQGSAAISETSGNLLESLKITPGTYTGTAARTVNQSVTFASGSANIDNTVTAGVFTINNVKFSVDPSKDSINSVLSRINSSSAGVTATYDSTSGTISLASDNPGSANKIVLGSSDDTSNILYALKLSSNNPPTGGTADSYAGSDAVLSINGAASITSSSNHLDGVIPGMSLDLAGTGTSTVSVALDTDSITSSVQGFVDNYNKVMTEIDAQLNAKSVQNPANGDDMFQGSLSNNSTLINLKSKLESLATDILPGMTGGINMAEEAGLSLTPTNNYQDVTLNFDSTKFTQMLNSNPDGMKQFFSSNTGFAQNIYTALGSYMAPMGPVSAEVMGLNSDITSKNSQITDFEARMVQEQNALQTEFADMEAAMSTMKNQMSYFSALGGSTSTSSSSSGASDTSSSSSSSSTGTSS